MKEGKEVRMVRLVLFALSIMLNRGAFSQDSIRLGTPQFEEGVWVAPILVTVGELSRLSPSLPTTRRLQALGVGIEVGPGEAVAEIVVARAGRSLGRAPLWDQLIVNSSSALWTVQFGDAGEALAEVAGAEVVVGEVQLRLTSSAVAGQVWAQINSNHRLTLLSNSRGTIRVSHENGLAVSMARASLQE